MRPANIISPFSGLIANVNGSYTYMSFTRILGTYEGKITRKNLCHIFQGDFLKSEKNSQKSKKENLKKKVSKIPKILGKS